MVVTWLAAVDWFTAISTVIDSISNRGNWCVWTKLRLVKLHEAPESTKAVAGIHWLTRIGTCNSGDILNEGDEDEGEESLLILMLLCLSRFKVLDEDTEFIED